MLVESPYIVHAPLRSLRLRPPMIWTYAALGGWLGAVALVALAELRRLLRRRAGQRRGGGPYRAVTAQSETAAREPPPAEPWLLYHRAAIVLIVTSLPSFITVLLRMIAPMLPI